MSHQLPGNQTSVAFQSSNAESTSTETGPPRCVDRSAAAAAINAFLRAVGVPPEADRELEQTGQRVADAWIDELLVGYSVDANQLLQNESARLEEPWTGGLLIVRDLHIATMCPHHLMPAMGQATVAVEPGMRLTGLGVIAQVVDAYCRRLTLQEHIGESVVEALMNSLEAKGAYCELTLRHACLSARGEKQPATIETRAARGTLVPLLVQGVAKR